MYEDILKFLKSKNKKLTKEEASEFIRLLAESVGYEEELGFHATIENSDDDLSTDINFVIDSINEGFSEEEDTFSIDGLSEEEEEDKEYVVLSKRKISRGKDFKRQKLDKKVSEENEDKVRNVCDINMNQEDEIGENEINENETGNQEEDKSKFSFSLPKTLNMSSGNFFIPKEEEEMQNSENKGFNLPENKGFNLPENKGFNLPENKGFNLPKFDLNAQDGEFKFDLGDLKDVNNTGPDYKFYDDENNEI